MANDYVEKIDLDGEQWDLKDSPLTTKIGDTDLSTFGDTVSAAIWGVYNSLSSKLEKINSLSANDRRNNNDIPQWYMNRYRIMIEFKDINAISATNVFNFQYGILVTISPWSDISGGLPMQLLFSNGGQSFTRGIAVRYANNTQSWSSWTKIH